MKGLKGGADAASPAAGDNNRGGLYHYGWENEESTTTDYTENAAPSEWVHYHSARHAGCLYELAGFDYKESTYDHVYKAYYYNGYFKNDYSGSLTRAVVDTNIDYVPNWVHFFNAHLLVGGVVSGSTAPAVSGTGDAGTGYSSEQSNANLVIANPQYEGLGFLNFIATYKVKGKDTGDHYQEFIDMTERTQNPGATGTTYNTINSASTQHADGIGGEWFFDGWMGTWTVDLQTTEWKSSLSSGTWTTNFAISSFPHNELGKDFRFNLRILHEEGTYESYYWYHVNEIVITFPHAVSYALHNDYKRGLTFSAADSVNSQTYQLMNVENAEERINIIPPLDLGTWDDVNFFRADDWIRTGADGKKINHIMGWLDTAASTKASWCTGTDAADENFCATKFKILGLMNTYDEHFAAQMGNIQEIWIQLSYAMQDVTNGVAYSTADRDYTVESPFPYLHFHATEISSIAATCSTTNVHNGNDCDAYTTNAHHEGLGPYSG
ncbi:Oidioi.mRNA.OKI2018_I69.chr1.g188.t1.cds [Oikopleura dioica]|nr:Oidioi.mRNA.OKI2018_I69.chr1.g188.t1.cds [Oikopleura dioica]